MRRTHLLLAIALAGLTAALLLPRMRGLPPQPPPRPTQTLPTVAPPPLQSGALTLRARPARGAFLASGDDFDVVYEITAATAASEKRLPVDFALVFDRSGSMTGEPLHKAKSAALSLIERLTPADRLAIVHFGSEARLAAKATVMDAAGKELATRIISGIEADGGTNMSDALHAARAALSNAAPREGVVRRIVLLSDGQANEGVIGPGLVQIASDLAAQKFRLSALGLGLEFDEDTMLALADAGRWQYRYLRNGDEVASALTQELSQAASTAATGVSLTLQPSEGVSIREIISYETERDGATVRLGLSDFAAGEFRRVVVRVHASAGSAGTRELIQARLAYEDAQAGHAAKSTAAVATAEATNDSGRVSQSVDKEAAKAGLRARWAGSLFGAAKSYESAGEQEASKNLDADYRSLRAEAEALADEALNEELEQQKAKAAAEMRAAPMGSSAARGVSKSLKMFGTSNARR